jgi:hypothetical protein
MDYSEDIRVIQEVARKGLSPHHLLRILLDRFLEREPDHFPIITIEHCLRRAFNIPLRILRDIEPWHVFTEQGTMNDQEIDQLLEPWIQRWLAEQKG